ncbi:MAG: peptidylprolyl isomerase [Aquificaceae bacterium]
MYSILHRHKTIAVAIITIATAGFFLWLFFTGGLTDITAPSKRCVAEVNSGCITLRDYRRELLRFSDLLKNPQMESLVRQQVLSNLITQELLYQKAKGLSLIASDEEIVETIKADPTFHEGGLFSSSKYREVLSKVGMTPEEYEEYLRRLLSIQKLLRLLDNAVYITEEELRINLLADSTLLKGKLYIVAPSEVKTQYTPSDRELLEYYQKNKELFKKPETRIVWVWKEKDKDKALALYKDLKGGKEAQGYMEYKLPQEETKLEGSLKEEVQRLTPQDRVSTFKEGDYYVVVYLKEVQPAGYEDYEKVKEKVKEKLIEERAQALAKERAEEVFKNLKEGKEVNLKALTFSDTPATQLSGILRINQEDLIRMVLSKDKVFGPYSLNLGYGVVLIEERKTKEIKEEEKKEIVKDLTSLKFQAILSRYIEKLEKEAKIKINKELLGGG